MDKVAVIGGGIVGSTTAFYLTKEGYDVVLFDQDKFQGTKAAVGIICPWVNQRRSKAWYNLVREGAAFYSKLLKDIGGSRSFVTHGTLIVNPKQHDKLWNIAVKRQKEAPAMGQVKQVENQGQWYDFSVKWEKGIYVGGGAQVNGLEIRNKIIENSLELGATFRKEKATITIKNEKYYVNDEEFKKIVIAVGPWLNESLESFTQERYKITKQRGVLAVFDLEQNKPAPVIMPEGEYDYLFREDGKVVVGATHENTHCFSKVYDIKAYDEMVSSARSFIPELKAASVIEKKIGYRAQSHNNIPFYGAMQAHPDIFIASGLGSSGLTTGPYIGYRLSQIITGNANLSDKDYIPKNHLQ